jgi:hypothetical protein
MYVLQGLQGRLSSSLILVLVAADVPDQPKEPFGSLVHSILSGAISPSMLLYHYRLRQVLDKHLLEVTLLNHRFLPQLLAKMEWDGSGAVVRAFFRQFYPFLKVPGFSDIRIFDKNNNGHDRTTHARVCCSTSKASLRTSFPKTT